jgi:hypothetical protein
VFNRGALCTSFASHPPALTITSLPGQLPPARSRVGHPV